MKIADCVARGTTTQAEADFRNGHFDVHIGQIGAYPLTGTRLEYSRPTFEHDYLIHQLGLAQIGAYVDLSSSVARRQIAQTVAGMVRSVGCEGVMLDTPFECAPGQEWLAVRLMLEIKAELPDRIVCPNFGDLWTWSDNTCTPKHVLAAAFEWSFCQVAMDADPKAPNGSSRFSRLVSTLNDRSKAGYTSIVGIYDVNGVNAARAVSIMDTLSAFKNTILHYNTSAELPLPLDLRRLQWNPYLPEPV